MWITQYYSVIFKSALWLSIIVTTINLLSLIGSYLSRIWIDHKQKQQKEWMYKWNELLEHLPPHSKKTSIVVDEASKKEKQVALRVWNHHLIEASHERKKELCDHAASSSLPDFALRQLAQGALKTKMDAALFLGFLEDPRAEDPLREHVNSQQTYLALASLWALVQIRPEKYIEDLIQKSIERKDFNFRLVGNILERCDRARISSSLVKTIRSMDVEVHDWLLRLLQFASYEDAAPMILSSLHSFNNAEVIANGLRLVREFRDEKLRGRVLELVNHPNWFVRVQAVKTLSTIGNHQCLEHLQSRLSDQNWWVRYRTAQTLKKLSSDRPRQLSHIAERTDDPFGKDILEHVLEETPSS